MIYKKCSRCELNYIMNDAPYCEVCLREMAGENFCDYCYICGKELEDDDIDICKECASLENEQQPQEKLED